MHTYGYEINRVIFASGISKDYSPGISTLRMTILIAHTMHCEISMVEGTKLFLVTYVVSMSYFCAMSKIRT